MTDPNQRCTCGFREFRDARGTTQSTVQRWMFFDDYTQGGFGATPFGTYFGAGIDGTWGEFEGTLTVTAQTVTCQNCQRVRFTKSLGSFTPIASYQAGAYYYVVGADLTRPVTCYDLRFDGPAGSGISITVPLRRFGGQLPPIAAPTPQTTAETPPQGAVIVDDQLRGRIPDIPVTATYTTVLVDRCAGTETNLATVNLEAPPMVITPSEAQLSGVPDLWLKQPLNLPTQRAFSTARGIPLDYCVSVVEYEARFGTLPVAQGWTHQAGAGVGVPGNYALVEGAALRGATPGSTNPSYFSKSSGALASTPSEVHGYASYLVESTTTTPAIGEGFDFQVLWGVSASAYRGVRWTHRDNDLYQTALNTGSEAVWSVGEDQTGPGWHETAGSGDLNSAILDHNNTREVNFSFGTTGTLPAQDEIVAIFGDVVGEGLIAYVQNFVVSTPGRFLRPWFRSVSPVTDPVLRLFLVADATAGGDRTATFKVRYGLGTAGPYTMPANEVSGTINFVDTNQVYELALNLSGMTANGPMWFTVERDWTDSNDLIQSTVWLLQGTVRSS